MKLRHINMAWLPSAVENGGLSSGFFRDKFLQDREGTLAAEMPVIEKAEYLFA